MLTVFLVTGFVASFGIYLLITYKTSSKTFKNSNYLKEPPGPRGLPIFGHLFYFGKNPGVTFMKWAKIYGPILSVKFGSFPAVVLNDAKLIKEAFKLDTFSGRVKLRNFTKPCDNKGMMLVDGHGQIEQRKFALKTFKREEFSKSELEFKAQEEISKFLKGIQIKCKLSFENREPEKNLIDNFFRFPVLNSLWVSIMGRALTEDGPTLSNLTSIMHGITRTGLLAQHSFFFPCISSTLTFLGLNSTVGGFEAIYNFMGEQIEESKENYVAGQPKNLTHAYFDQVSQTTRPESSFFKGYEQRYTTGDIFMAAIDTTTVSLDWLLLYMAREPQIQQKLQAEIDDILGFVSETNPPQPRTPSIDDRVRMPYTDAVIKELLRISSIIPLALYHRATEDVSFHGYIIPKDTMIIPNLYGIHHDPEIWPEPDFFQPERFLNRAEEGNSGTLTSAGHLLPFSSGKRNCIGEAFAWDQLFLITTHFFQKFTVSCTDKVPSLEYDFGFILKPQPFELLISERNFSNNI